MTAMSDLGREHIIHENLSAETVWYEICKVYESDLTSVVSQHKTLREACDALEKLHPFRNRLCISVHIQRWSGRESMSYIGEYPSE